MFNDVMAFCRLIHLFLLLIILNIFVGHVKMVDKSIRNKMVKQGLLTGMTYVAGGTKSHLFRVVYTPGCR